MLSVVMDDDILSASCLRPLVHSY